MKGRDHTKVDLHGYGHWLVVLTGETKLDLLEHEQRLMASRDYTKVDLHGYGYWLVVLRG